jgi:hypothetical protein
VIDVKANVFRTLPIQEVLDSGYPVLRHIASIDKGDYLSPVLSRIDAENADHLILTFEELTKDQNFVKLMQTILKKLERNYGWPVDIEFTAHIEPDYPRSNFTISILQCRPLVRHEWTGQIEIPEGIPENDVIFEARRLVPEGVVSGVRYVVFVDPNAYNRVPDYVVKLELGRVIGRINKGLEGERFILIGPGRWGSSNVDLGVKVTYADIFNAKMLVEIPLVREGSTAEASYGTHFFQDLVETGIYPLPVNPDEDGATLNVPFLMGSPNKLRALLPADAKYAEYIRVIDVPAVTGGRFLKIVMDGANDQALAYVDGTGRKRGVEKADAKS